MTQFDSTADPVADLILNPAMGGGTGQPAQPQKTRVAGFSPDPLQLPEGVSRWHIRWPIAIFIAGIHLLSVFAVLPWLFSWSGVLFAAVGCYLFGTLGINLCYHRLLTHRSFTCPKWFEYVVTLLGFCNLQGSSVQWVGAHRAHHQHSDHRPDPHSPLVDFLWSHMWWMMVFNPNVDAASAKSRYAADLCRDGFHLYFEKHYRWIGVWAAHVLLIVAAGCGVGLAQGGGTSGALQMGLSWLIWGVMVRTVVVWHITWAINSVTHLWGYQNYKSTDHSKNNLLLGYISMGEGWHNNHHADQSSAAHGHKWWELDITYLTIRALGLVGLARDIKMPSRFDGTKLAVDQKKLDQ